MDFKDWIASRGPLDETKLFKKNSDLLKMCLNETFLWQDRPQRFTLLGHSGITLRMTSILGNDPKNLEEQILSENCNVKKKIPRINRVESASFTLLKVLKPELTANDFVNPVEEMDEYCERQKQLAEIIAKLNHLIRL
ncbi:unnamed protein product [Gongylonema pulchrum]|uniref:Uncharacterized protein n=1 Tax=Gongylonema pulchrum TaxID=637853 RepID=A0A183DY89_9BILA|nr:unnamed protein product [Gongylonema pulchrum]